METRPFIDTPERLAAVVHEARTVRGYTQADLSKKAGVGRRFIVDLESGHPRAEIGLVMNVLKALDLAPRAVPVMPGWAFRKDGTLKSKYRKVRETTRTETPPIDGSVSELTRALRAKNR